MVSINDKEYNVSKKALGFAILKHSGQFRKFNNEPYINHPKRVAELFVDEKTKAAAYLHDVLEDTDTSEEEMLLLFPSYVVETVKLLTRTTETYFDFLMKIKNSNNLDAICIKLSDIHDNLKDLKEGSLKDKYRLAQYILQQHLIDCQTLKETR